MLVFLLEVIVMHVEKYNARAIGRMFNHYERQEGDGVKRGNPAFGE